MIMLFMRNLQLVYVISNCQIIDAVIARVVRFEIK